MDNEINAPDSATPAPAGPVRTTRRAGTIWSIRTIAAAAITAVALAGTGGAVLAATTDGGTSAGPGRGGFMQPGQLGRTGQMPGPGQGTVPGQRPGMSRVPQLPFSTDPQSRS